jgi:hypothetical protein
MNSGFAVLQAVSEKKMCAGGCLEWHYLLFQG